MRIDPLNAADVLLLRRLSAGLPITERPYADVAAELGCSEDDVIGCLRRLLAAGAVTHFGPIHRRRGAGLKRLLCALEVPRQRFAQVAELLGALPQVVDNVHREHRWNLWLTVEGRSAADLRATRAQIESLTGLRVLRLPRQKTFFPELRLRASERSAAMPSALDRRLAAATRAGLPLVSRPYDEVGARLGVSGELVRHRFDALLRSGRVRRIGPVLAASRLGFAVDLLTVWDVDDARVDELGEKVGGLGFVALCCRRPRAGPEWPYNLHVALHARSRAEAERALLQIHCLLADACRAHDALYRSSDQVAMPAPAHLAEPAL